MIVTKRKSKITGVTRMNEITEMTRVPGITMTGIPRMTGLTMMTRGLG